MTFRVHVMAILALTAVEILARVAAYVSIVLSGSDSIPPELCLCAITISGQPVELPQNPSLQAPIFVQLF